MNTPSGIPNRGDILDREFVRRTPGLRPFSVGVMMLCQMLGLKILTGAATKEESRREFLALTFLLDERHSVDEISLAVDAAVVDEAGRKAFDARLKEYGFGIEPAFLMRVQAEFQRAEMAVAAAVVKVEPKPGEKKGPEPPNS